MPRCARWIAEMFPADVQTQQELGQAANQVDLPYRLFIVNLKGEPTKSSEEFVFINPVLSKPGVWPKKRKAASVFQSLYANVHDRLTLR